MRKSSVCMNALLIALGFTWESLASVQTIEDVLLELSVSSSTNHSQQEENILARDRQELAKRIISVKEIGAELDPIYEAKALLQRHIGKVSALLEAGLKKLASHLDEPEELIYWSKTHGAFAALEERLIPTNLLFTRIQELVKELRKFQVNCGDYPALHEALQTAAEFYEVYITRLCNAPLAERASLLERKVRMSGDELGVYRISQAVARQMISRSVFNKRARQGQAFGQHDVRPLGGIHFKRLASLNLDYEDESFPGMEYAIYSLSRILGYTIIAPSMVIILDGVKTLELPETDELVEKEREHYETLRKQFSLHELLGKDPEQALASDLGLRKLEHYFRLVQRPHILQASLSIEGLNAQELLEQTPQNLNTIHPDNLSQHFILSLLANLEDAKPDNFIVEQASNQAHIIGIDNDHAFTHSIISGAQNSHYISVRNFFYCLNAVMYKPISSELKNNFLKNSPLHMIFSWLHDLEEQNHRYNQLRQRHLKLLAEHTSAGDLTKLVNKFQRIFETQLYIPLHLMEGTIKSLFHKMESLHSLMARDGSLTPDRTLKQMDPLVGHYYQFLRQKFGPDLFEMISVLYQTGEDIPLEKALAKIYTNPQELTNLLAPHTAHPFDYEKNRTQTLEEAYTELAKECLASQKNPLAYAMQQKVPAYALNHILAAGASLDTVDEEGNSPLHLAVLHVLQDQQRGISYVQALLKAGVSARRLNHQQHTPLDLALEHRIPEAVIELVAAGYGTHMHPRLGTAFYEALHGTPAWTSALEKAWQQLEVLNPALRWRLALYDLFRPSEAPVSEGLTFGKGDLSPKFKEALRPNQPIEVTLARYRFTAQRKPISYSLHYAISHFIQRAIGTGATPTELIRVMYPEKGAPIEVNLPWSETSLAQTTIQYPALMAQLETNQVSHLILASILLNLHAPTLEAYQAYPSGAYPLLYNMALLKPTAAFGKDEDKPLSALYCLDVMQRPLSPAVKDHFLLQEPSKILRIWLDDLKHYERRIGELFTIAEHHSYDLQIPLPVGSIAQLYNRFLSLQDLLKQEGVTPLDVLQNLSPITGQFIKKLFELNSEDQSFKMRFYEMRKAPAFTASSQSIWQRTELAFNELSAIYDLHQDYQAALQELPHGQTNAFYKLNPEWKHKVIAHLDFKEITPLVQKSIFRDLQSYPVTTLTLHHLEAIDDKILLPLLKHSSQLKQLELVGLPSITMSSLDKLTEYCSQLTNFTLQHSKVKEFAYNQFIKSNFLSLPALVYLNLSDNRYLAKVKLDVPLLIEAQFSNDTSLQANQLQLKAPYLTHLSLQNCSQFTNYEVDILKQQFYFLKSLNILGTDLPFAAIRSANLHYPYMMLTQNSPLESRLVRILANDIEEADLSSLNLTNDDMIGLAEALEKNKSLTSLNLQNNIIGNVGLQHLAKSLHAPLFIADLDLSQNQIDQDGARILGELIRNYLLKSLSISGNPIGNAGITNLSQEILFNNTSLTRLALRSCSITSQEIPAVTKLISHTQELAYLDLGRNQIGDEGALAIAAAIKNHYGLTDLNLRSCGIGSAGGKALAEAINAHTIMLYVDLNSNKVDAEDLKVIGEALRRNKMLKQTITR